MIRALASVIGLAALCAGAVQAQETITTTPLDQIPQSTLPWSLDAAPLDQGEGGSLNPRIEVSPLDPSPTDPGTIPDGTEDGPRLTFRRNEPQELPKPEVAEADIAILRALDKVNGRVETFELGIGATTTVFQLAVGLSACRYPKDNPAGEAYAWLDVAESESRTSVFSGWMIASSPALSAMDHPRYDVWVLRCKTS